jgi:hypothetical protein
MLRDCHLLECMMMFVSVAYQFYHGRIWHRSRSSTAAHGESTYSLLSLSGPAANAESLTNLQDALIDACAASTYALLRETMTAHLALTVLYLSGINSMVRHISLGAWRLVTPCLAPSSRRCHHHSLHHQCMTTDFLPSGWDPPIEEILAAASDGEAVKAAAGGAAAPDAEGGAKRAVAGWSQYKLSMADLYQLVLELHRAYMRKQIRGTKILNLL